MTKTALPRAPVAHQNPVEDRLLAMVSALAGELSVARERLDTVERLAEAGGSLRRDDIETYTPDEPASLARTATRKRLIARVFRPLRDDAERAAAVNR